MLRDLRVNSYITIPAAELSVAYSRSGGPGGQNVNKVASKATLRFNLRATASMSEEVKHCAIQKLSSRLTNEGEILIMASEHRDAPKNLDAALARMEDLLRNAIHVARKRKATKPTRGSNEKRIVGKKVRGQIKRNRREWEE